MSALPLPVRERILTAKRDHLLALAYESGLNAHLNRVQIPSAKDDREKGALEQGALEQEHRAAQYGRAAQECQALLLEGGFLL